VTALWRVQFTPCLWVSPKSASLKTRIFQNHWLMLLYQIFSTCYSVFTVKNVIIRHKSSCVETATKRWPTNHVPSEITEFAGDTMSYTTTQKLRFTEMLIQTYRQTYKKHIRVIDTQTNKHQSLLQVHLTAH